MPILGIGIDMVKVPRMEGIIERRGRPFLDRIFTEAEQRYCFQHRMAPLYFSGRFAAKEALLKAMGTGLGNGVSFREIETLRASTGKPSIQLSGRVRELADQKGVYSIFSSITHDGDYAIAQVVLEGKV